MVLVATSLVLPAVLPRASCNRSPTTHPGQHGQSDDRKENDVGQADERRGNQHRDIFQHEADRPHRFDLDCGAHRHHGKKAEADERNGDDVRQAKERRGEEQENVLQSATLCFRRLCGGRRPGIGTT